MFSVIRKKLIQNYKINFMTIVSIVLVFIAIFTLFFGYVFLFDMDTINFLGFSILFVNLLVIILGIFTFLTYFKKSKNLKEVYHGVASKINVVKEDLIFDGLSNPLNVGRYHSWVVEEPIPDCLEILAFDENNQIMAIKHKEYNIRGVQFHPESILTEQGKELLKNWLKLN